MNYCEIWSFDKIKHYESQFLEGYLRKTCQYYIVKHNDFSNMVATGKAMQNSRTFQGLLGDFPTIFKY